MVLIFCRRHIKGFVKLYIFITIQFVNGTLHFVFKFLKA